MAGKSKNSRNTGGKKSSSSSGAKGRKKVQEEESSFIYTEVAIILSFAVAVLCFLCNFRLCGALGEVLRSVQLGIFGIVGYAAPILLFAGTCFILANRGSALARIKMAAVIAGVLVLCGLAQMVLGGGYVPGMKFSEIYARCAQTGMGGGVLGGLLAQGIGSVLGTIGTYLILLVGLVICIVCITEKSVVSVVKKGSGRAYQYAREDVERRHEIHQEKKEERRRLREEQKVRGVNLNSTKLEAPTGPEQEPARRAADGYSRDARTGEMPEEDYGREEDYGQAEDYGRAEDYGQTEDYGRAGESAGDYGYIDEDSVPGPAVWSGRDSDGNLPEFDPEVGNQAFMKDLLPDAQEKGWDPADVFRGSINRPPVYIDTEDDTVPFDGEDQRWNERDDFAGEDDFRTDYRSPDAETEAESEAAMTEPATEEYKSEAAMTESAAAEYKPAAAEYKAEAAEYKPAAAEYKAEAAEPETETEEEPEWSGEAEPEAEAGAGRTAAETLRTTGEFVVPEEGRRIVTATGKIIESDTEALRKKIETSRKEAQETKNGGVNAEIARKPVVKKEYVFPPMNLLKRGSGSVGSKSDKEYRETAIKLQQTLRDFGVGVTVTDVSCGPSVTRYELHPEQGVKVSKIVGLTDDIKLSLAAADIRIEAPIPGKSAVGIEVPNKENNVVYLREVLETPEFLESKSRLTFAVGKDIGGQVVVTDIAKMPHLLIAGSTGSGKSVCINTLIMSIIYKADPDDVKVIMVDPKVVELSVYNGIPHLLIPVVTDPKKAAGALNWAVAEMDDRYKKFAQYNVRDLKGYNAKVESIQDIEDENKPAKMPQIVIIIDELADLMMVAPGEVEGSICRLAQLARAAGIHLVIATQRPSVDVITGLIKANVPSRIAFAVSSGVDSRTILDMVGAEKLLGKGDMLFYPAGTSKPVRVQGAFVSDGEVSSVVEFLTRQNLGTEYSEEIQNQIAMPAAAAGGDGRGDRDEYFAQAGRFIIEKEKGSIGMLQRMFKIGFNRAARIMDQLAEAGVVGDEEGTKPRKILMTMEEFEAMLRDE